MIDLEYIIKRYAWPNKDTSVVVCGLNGGGGEWIKDRNNISVTSLSAFLLHCTMAQRYNGELRRRDLENVSIKRFINPFD